MVCIFQPVNRKSPSVTFIYKSRWLFPCIDIFITSFQSPRQRGNRTNCRASHDRLIRSDPADASNHYCTTAIWFNNSLTDIAFLKSLSSSQYISCFLICKCCNYIDMRCSVDQRSSKCECCSSLFYCRPCRTIIICIWM